MHPITCINTHLNTMGFVNHGMVKYTKPWLSREHNITFLWNKKILNLWLRWHILRSYCFVFEATVNKSSDKYSWEAVYLLWFSAGVFQRFCSLIQNNIVKCKFLHRYFSRILLINLELCTYLRGIVIWMYFSITFIIDSRIAAFLKSGLSQKYYWMISL